MYCLCCTDPVILQSFEERKNHISKQGKTKRNSRNSTEWSDIVEDQAFHLDSHANDEAMKDTSEQNEEIILQLEQPPAHVIDRGDTISKDVAATLEEGLPAKESSKLTVAVDNISQVTVESNISCKRVKIFDARESISDVVTSKVCFSKRSDTCISNTEIWNDEELYIKVEEAINALTNVKRDHLSKQDESKGSGEVNAADMQDDNVTVEDMVKEYDCFQAANRPKAYIVLSEIQRELVSRLKTQSQPILQKVRMDEKLQKFINTIRGKSDTSVDELEETLLEHVEVIRHEKRRRQDKPRNDVLKEVMRLLQRYNEEESKIFD